jgi:23S rRNA pseudouridine2605 synthase
MARQSEKHPPFPAELRDAARGVRLHKAMADAGVGSRRKCEQLIEQKLVTVNGYLVRELPVWVDPAQDKIEVDGKPVARKKRQLGKLYLMINKPRGVICTNKDELNRKRIIDLVPHHERLHCVGRLDAESTGLVLLTNDGDLTQQLTHPSHGVPKTYRVTIKGRLDEDEVERLTEGIYLADRTGKQGKARATKVRLVDRHVDRSRLEITLREGRNREIRRMLARLGHKVTKLRRTAIASVPLKGVASGEWRALTRAEVAALRRAARG